MADASGRVFVIGPDGEQGYLPQADAEEALASGFQLGTPEQVQQHELKKKYGSSTTQEVMAGAEAAGRALTLGASTPVQVALGADPEAIKAREELNPVAAGIGTAVGIAAPLVLTAGASAVPQAGARLGVMGAARAIAGSTAPALISRAGQAVTKGVQAVLPEAAGLAGQALTKAAAVGAGGALEGAAYGIGQVIHEAALGDPNLTAESALGTVGLSAALGGGFAGLLGVGEVVAPAALGRAKEAIGGLLRKGQEGLETAAAKAAELGGTAPDVATLMIEHRATVSALEKQLPGVADDIANATPEMAEWLMKNADRLREMETAFPGATKSLARTSPETADFLANNWQKVITDPTQRARVAGELREGMQSVLDQTDDVLREMNTKFAPREAEALLATADSAAVARGYESTVGKIDDAIAAMRAEPELHSNAMARHLEKVREGLIRDADSRLNPVEAFNRLKDLRQSLDEAIPYGKNALSLGFSERNSANLLKDVRRSVKQALTDESVFGPAAARRAALDDAQREWLQLTQRGGSFRKAFLDSTGSVPSTKVDTWLNSLAKDKGVESAEAWGKLLAASKKVISEAEASYKAAPVGEFNRIAVDRVVDTAAKLAEEAQAAGKATATMKYLSTPGGVGIPNSGPFTPGMGLAAKAAELVLPGAVTSAVKATLNIAQTARSVPKMVSILSALDEAGKVLSRHIDVAAGVLVRGSAKATRVGRSEVAAGIASSFGKTPEEARSTFLRRAKDIQSNASPAVLHDKLTAQADPLQDSAPNTAGALQASTARGVAFLQSKLPKPPNNGPLGPKWVPSQAEISKFNRYYEAVENPTSILKQAAAGVLTPEAVEAVRTVYPALYDQMKTAILDKITSHRGQVPSKSRLMLGLLLGQDVDGSLKPERILRSQAAFAASSARAAQTSRGPGSAKADSKITLAERSRTPMERAQQRGDE